MLPDNHKKLTFMERCRAMISEMQDFLFEVTTKNRYPVLAAIEEPIYSWGRKNPKGFCRQAMFFALLIDMLLDLKITNINVVNPKTVKRMAGHGGADKGDMISWVFKRWPEFYDIKTSAKRREALADAMAIAQAGWLNQYQRVNGVTKVENFR